MGASLYALVKTERRKGSVAVSADEIHAPVIDLVNMGRRDVVLMYQPMDNGKTIREIFCEITAVKVGDIGSADFFHR